MLLETAMPVAIFVIDPVDITDSGKYRCLAENKLGALDGVFDVRVADFFEDDKKGIHSVNLKLI